MSTLKQLIDQQKSLEENLIEAYGEISESMEKDLAEIELKLPEKVDRYAGFIDKLAIDYMHFSTKAERFQKTADQIKALKDSLNEHIKHQMISHDLKELRGIDEVFSLQNGKASIEISDQSKIPRTYIKQVVSEQPDKEELRKALERGEVFNGVSLKPTVVLRRKLNKRI